MSLKKPTAAELADLVREAHRSCRCDGGCTNCGACSAERKLDMYIRSGLVVRTAASKAFTDPTYTLVGKPAPKVKVRWVMHKDYAHVAGQPCVECNPPTELERYRACMKNCYCPAPTASGYKPLCGNCQEAQTLVPAILERMGIK